MQGKQKERERGKRSFDFNFNVEKRLPGGFSFSSVLAASLSRFLPPFLLPVRVDDFLGDARAIIVAQNKIPLDFIPSLSLSLFFLSLSFLPTHPPYIYWFVYAEKYLPFSDNTPRPFHPHPSCLARAGPNTRSNTPLKIHLVVRSLPPFTSPKLRDHFSSSFFFSRRRCDGGGPPRVCSINIFIPF